MMYAFARDGGLPGSKFFAYVNTTWRSPIRTGEHHYCFCGGYLLLTVPEVWLACTLSFILGLPVSSNLRSHRLSDNKCSAEFGQCGRFFCCN